MFVRDLKDCEEFTAGDNCILRELFNPLKEELTFRYSLAHATVKPGNTTYHHRLKSSEVYFILQGKGLMHIDGEECEVGIGQAIYIPPNAVQYISNTGQDNLVFVCMVDPAWRKEDEEVMQD